MRIYFAASIAGGRKYLATYQQMASYMKAMGHSILTEHITSPSVWHLESGLTPEQIYSRDVKWLQESDCLVAEVSNPSLGVGYEICYALTLTKPVLCLYREEVLLSRMILGNTRPGLLVRSYSDAQQWQELVARFLHTFAA